VQRLFNLALIYYAAATFVYPIELIYKKTFELLVILDFEAHDATVVALIDFIIILANESVQEYLIIQSIDGSLLLLLLKHKETCEDAFVHCSMDKCPNFFFCQCMILNKKRKR